MPVHVFVWPMINSPVFSLRPISGGILGSVPFTPQSEDVMSTSSYSSLVFPILSIWSLNVSLCSRLLFLARVGFSCLSCSPFTDVFASLYLRLISAKSNHIGLNSFHWFVNKRMLQLPSPALCPFFVTIRFNLLKPSLSLSLFYPCIVHAPPVQAGSSFWAVLTINTVSVLEGGGVVTAISFTHYLVNEATDCHFIFAVVLFSLLTTTLPQIILMTRIAVVIS